jgi:hypothetical protein
VSRKTKEGDGRLKMARELERRWPGVVETKRRFNRPQHVVKYAWRKFDNKLKLKPGIDLKSLQPNEYGIELKAVKPIRSDLIKQLVATNAADVHNAKTRGHFSLP